jgi:hypothetical protein
MENGVEIINKKIIFNYEKIFKAIPSLLENPDVSNFLT